MNDHQWSLTNHQTKNCKHTIRHSLYAHGPERERIMHSYYWEMPLNERAILDMRFSREFCRLIKCKWINDKE